MWLRLRQIALVAHRLGPVIDDLVTVLGIEPCFVDPGVGAFGLENTLLPVGDQFLEIVSPVRDGTAGGRYLGRRGGDGGYMVILQCDEHDRRKRRAAELGIRVVWGSDRRAYRSMQLHPRDTGGSFLEIDEQLGERAHELDGPWHPAGPAWQRAKRTGIVSAITAAELQSEDPSALARRWSEILETALVADDQGRPSLRLDNAALRFVPAVDGRGEGLGGIDVMVTDPTQVLGAARDRGCLHDGTVMIGGLRVIPVRH